MNAILLISDTFRLDHLAAYGSPPPWGHPGHEGEPFVRTPNLDHLAGQSALFDRFYVSSYPTVPCRYDLLSGRFGFTTRGWQPLESGDVLLPELLAAGGVTPTMIFDTPMVATDSYNYTRGFAGWDFVRGQHGDRYVVDPTEITLPSAPHKVKAGTGPYLRNTAFRKSENDWMCAQTCTRAMEWLERNRKSEGFVLWVDMWDPHEPFDAPEFDLDRYADPAFRGDRVIYPRYGRPDYMSDAERDFVRASYAALVSSVDRWVGRLLEKLQTLRLDESTLVLFLSDHGHLFGDHDLQGKPSGPLGKLYEVTTRVPLLIRHPEGLGAGARIDGIAQHPDIAPTILDFFGLAVPEGMHGRSLVPMLGGNHADGRPFAVSGRHSPIAAAGGRARDEDAAAFDGTAGLQTHGEPGERAWLSGRRAASSASESATPLKLDPVCMRPSARLRANSTGVRGAASYAGTWSNCGSARASSENTKARFRGFLEWSVSGSNR
jgi:arylsulfatase A-like enzyme